VAIAIPPATPEPEPVAPEAAANVAAPAAGAIAPKFAQAVATGTQEEPAAGTDAAASPSDVVSDVKPVVGADTASTPAPAEMSAVSTAPTTQAPAQATIVAAAALPKPVASSTPALAEGDSQKAPPAAVSETSAAETQPPSKRSAADPGAAPVSQTPNNAVKPQAGVQAVAADAAPDVKADAPAPASSNTSTSFADLLARGAPADAGKPPVTHPAMQAAPQAAVQVYARIVERFDGRAQRFEVRLDPAELGRVDVRIEIGADKKVHAVLAAHDSAALSDLMRGQRALERALADAGIDLKDGGVKFELANDSNRGLAGQERDAWQGDDLNVWRGFSTVDVPVETDAPVATVSFRRASRLDLVA
jgi:flagellar hook-length control protein FliK